jgi:hypothetical protein
MSEQSGARDWGRWAPLALFAAGIGVAYALAVFGVVDVPYLALRAATVVWGVTLFAQLRRGASQGQLAEIERSSAFGRRVGLGVGLVFVVIAILAALRDR